MNKNIKKKLKRKLDREKTIKALECCASLKYACSECPVDEDLRGECVCGTFVMQNALTLIKELTEENERLIEAGFDTVDYAIDKLRRVKVDTVRKCRRG